MRQLWRRGVLGGALAGLGFALGSVPPAGAQEPWPAPSVLPGPPVPVSVQPPDARPPLPPGYQPAFQPGPARPAPAPVAPAVPDLLPDGSPLVPSVLPGGGLAPLPVPGVAPAGGFAPDPLPIEVPMGAPAAGAPPVSGMPPMGGMPAMGMPPAGGPPLGTGMGVPPPGGTTGTGAGTGGTSVADKLKMTARWNTPNPGVWIETADKNFVLHPGGTVHYDAAWYSASPLLELGRGGTGKFNDGANMRRARIFFEGTAYHQVDFRFELEFMNGIGFSPPGTQGPVTQATVTNAPGPTDAYINVKDVPFFGNVRIGNQKEWFSLEHINNYRALEFMERSYLFDFSQITRYNNGFTPGVSVFRTWLDERVFTGAGVYKNDPDLIGFNIGDGQYAFTGRVAALPVWMPEERAFWHVGGAMSHRDPVNGVVNVTVRDNVRSAPFPLLNLLINTGNINAGSQDLYNLETAAVWGPVTFESEYTANVVNRASVGTGPGQGSLLFQGYYAEVMWLLTGESRTFNRQIYALNRVVPKRPLWFKKDDGCDCERGFGAWEVGVRYTYLDVSDKAVQAGRLDSVTLGLNWYLNTAAKLQFNYDYTRRGDIAAPSVGHVHAFGTRMAVDF